MTAYKFNVKEKTKREYADQMAQIQTMQDGPEKEQVIEQTGHKYAGVTRSIQQDVQKGNLSKVSYPKRPG